MREKTNKIQTTLGIVYTGLIMIMNFIFNLKFVQIGIPDWLMSCLYSSLSPQEIMPIVTGGMLTLGFTGLLGCLFSGYILQKYNVSFKSKIKWITILTGIIILLVFLSEFVTKNSFLVWLVGFAFIFGFSSCIAYTFIFDLIPGEYRGLSVGVFTAIIYFTSASSSETWSFVKFRSDILILLLIGYSVMLVFLLFGLLDSSNVEERQKEGKKYEIKLSTVILLLFLVLFVDSFGFLRVISEGGLHSNKTILSLTWQNSDRLFRLLIGISHAIFAILSGLFYDKLKPFSVLLLSLTLLIAADLMMAVSTFGEVNSVEIVDSFMKIQYIFPPIYAAAVSIYTVVCFAIIADISDEDSINRNAAWGMAIVGWFSSYVAAGTSLYLGTIIPFYIHLILAATLAILAFLLTMYCKVQLD